MSASAKASIHSSIPPHFEGWSTSECTVEKVNELMVKKFRELVAEYQGRKTEHLVNEGFWYGNENYLALEAQQKTDPTASQQIAEKRKTDQFFHGIPPLGFVQVENKEAFTGIAPFSYVLKKGILPSEALHSVHTSLCFLDCQEVVETARYEVLHETLGTRLFNSSFAEEPHLLQLDRIIQSTPLCNAKDATQSFITTIELAEGALPKLGDNVYFKNTPLYVAKHPNGINQGTHALCTVEGDSPRFTCFGLENRDYTSDEILQYLVEAFNEEPLGKGRAFTDEVIEMSEDALYKSKPITQDIVSKIRNMTLPPSPLPPRMGLIRQVTRFNVGYIKSLLPS